MSAQEVTPVAGRHAGRRAILLALDVDQHPAALIWLQQHMLRPKEDVVHVVPAAAFSLAHQVHLF